MVVEILADVAAVFGIAGTVLRGNKQNRSKGSRRPYTNSNSRNSRKEVRCKSNSNLSGKREKQIAKALAAAAAASGVTRNLSV